MKKLVPKKREVEITENTESVSETDSGPNSSRARAEAKLSAAIKREPAVSKVVKKAAQLADLITHEDREDNVRVLREAKHAMHRVSRQAAVGP